MSIKILHIADLHLLNDFNIDINMDINTKMSIQWEVLRRAIKFSNSNGIDLILIAGDMLEAKNLSLFYFKRYLEILGSAKAKIIHIFGNHDYFNAIKDVFEKAEIPKNISFVTSDNLEKIIIEDKNICVYAKSWVNDYYGRTEIDTNDIDSNFINILLAHSEVKTGEAYMPIDLEKIYTHFDYIALGHVHKREKILDNAFYSGSMEPVTIDELGNHGGLFIEVSDKKIDVKNVNFASSFNHRINVDFNDISLEKLIAKLSNNINHKLFNSLTLIIDGITTGIRKEDIEYSLKDLFKRIKIIDNTRPELIIDDYSKNEIKEVILELVKNNKIDENLTEDIYKKIISRILEG